MRASDRDRDRTAAVHGRGDAAGRLDAAEFSDRLERAYRAKTIGELEELTADLPPVDLYPLPWGHPGSGPSSH